MIQTNAQIANSFNQLAGGLAQFQTFITTVQSGGITLYTDGQGNFRASCLAYSPDTGVQLPNQIVYLNISQIQAAATSMATLQTLLAAATVQ